MRSKELRVKMFGNQFQQEGEAKKCEGGKFPQPTCSRDATQACMAYPEAPYYLCEVHALEHSLHKQFISGITY